MHSEQIFKLIEKASQAKRPAARERILADLVRDEEGRRVLSTVVDSLPPFQGDIPEPDYAEKVPSRVMGDASWALLDDLRRARLSGRKATTEIQDQVDSLSANSAELFSRILRKDLGISADSIKSVLAGYTEQMRQYDALMADEPRLLEQVREINARLDQMGALRLANLILARFEAEPRLASLTIELGEEKFDNGYFITPMAVQSFNAAGKEITGKADEDMTDVLREMNLNELPEDIIEGGIDVERATAEECGYFRDRFAMGIGLIERPDTLAKARP